MIVKEDTRVRAWVIKQLMERLGREPRTGPWHASEIFQCPRKSILLREKNPPLTEEQVLNFIRGFAIQEYIFGAEEDGEEALGVILSPDFVEGKHIFEMKTTKLWYETKSKGKFDPRNMSDWMRRTVAYVAALEKEQAHIIVWFMGQTDIHAWTIIPNDKEKAEARAEVEFLRDRLTAHNEAYQTNGTLPPVTQRAYDKECGFCTFYDQCYPELKKEGLVDAG